MATPAAERRYRVLILDRAPEMTGTLELPALDCDAGEDTDTEYLSGPIFQLLCELEGITGAHLRLIDAT